LCKRLWIAEGAAVTSRLNSSQRYLDDRKPLRIMSLRNQCLAEAVVYNNTTFAGGTFSSAGFGFCTTTRCNSGELLLFCGLQPPDLKAKGEV
jgi:hypothetical protein